MTTTVRAVLVLVAAWASVALAQSAAPVDVGVAPADEAPPATPPPPSAPPPPPPVDVAAPPPVVPPPAVGNPVVPRVPAPPPVEDRSVGIHVAVNLGLFAFDVHQGHFYGFVSANAGIPLVSNGDIGAFALGLGYSAPLSHPDESMWFLDFFFEALPGWWNLGSRLNPSFFVGAGVGLGFRYLHRSGFTVGFKLPVFGASFSSAVGFTAAASVGTYYLFNAIALPVISFGYRF